MKRALFAFFALGCSANPGAPCTHDGDCAADEMCVDGACMARLDASAGTDSGFARFDAQNADVVCVGVEDSAREIRRPIDAIVLPDESASMGVARDAVALAMETTFRTTMEEAGVDYRVIWHGLTPLPMIEATGRLTRNGVQLGSGDNAMFQPVLDSYDAWRPALREDAIKVFVHFTDATSGQGAQITGYTGMFDEVLVAREPAVWGTPPDYRFVYHTFVGLPINTPPETPYAPGDPIAAGTCSESFVNPGPLQEMARRTGGLRFPLCLPDRFDAVFRAIAESAIARAAVPCELVLPDPPEGMTIDPSTIAVRYTAGDESRTVFLRAESLDACDASSFLIAEEERVVLCPEACARVEADPGARLTVLSGCDPVLY
jgi:hypothetical protein